jgi:hypothetical protein
MPYIERTEGAACERSSIQPSSNPGRTGERSPGEPILRWPSATITSHEREMPSFPDWWRWELTFTSHAELRMEQRGVTEVEVRAMLEEATGFEPSVVDGRFMVHARHAERPWVVIVEPDADVNLLVVVTVYEVSE